MAIEKITDDEFENESLREDDGLPRAGRPPKSKRKYEVLPLPENMRPILLNMLARQPSNKGNAIAAATTRAYLSKLMLTEYNVLISPDDIKQLAITEADAISKLRKKVERVPAVNRARLIRLADSMVEREANRMVMLFDRRDALDAALQAGAIDEVEHRRAINNVRTPSLNDIIRLAQYLKPPAATAPVQLQLPSNFAAQLPPGGSPEATALAKELGEAVARGDQVKIQQLVWQKKSEPAVEQ